MTDALFPLSGEKHGHLPNQTSSVTEVAFAGLFVGAFDSKTPTFFVGAFEILHRSVQQDSKAPTKRPTKRSSKTPPVSIVSVNQY